MLFPERFFAEGIVHQLCSEWNRFPATRLKLLFENTHTQNLAGGSDALVLPPPRFRQVVQVTD